MGFGIILGFVLLILKVTHYIDWNWFIILLPFIVDFILAIVIFVFGIKLFGSHMKEMKRMEDRYRSRDW